MNKPEFSRKDTKPSKNSSFSEYINPEDYEDSWKGSVEEYLDKVSAIDPFYKYGYIFGYNTAGSHINASSKNMNTSNESPNPNSTSNSNVKPLLTHRSQSTRTNINHISQLNSPRTNFQNNRHQSVSNLLGDSSRQKNTVNKGGLERRFSVKPSGLMGTLTRKMSKIWTKGEVDSNNSNLSSGHSGNNFFGVS